MGYVVVRGQVEQSQQSSAIVSLPYFECIF